MVEQRTHKPLVTGSNPVIAISTSDLRGSFFIFSERLVETLWKLSTNLLKTSGPNHPYCCFLNTDSHFYNSVSTDYYEKQTPKRKIFTRRTCRG